MQRIKLTGKKLKDLFYFTTLITDAPLWRVDDKNIYTLTPDHMLINDDTGKKSMWKGIDYEDIIKYMFERMH